MGMAHPCNGSSASHFQGNTMTIRIASFLLAGALAALPAAAQEDTGAAKTHALVESLHFQTGDIALPDAGAHVRVQQGFRYLGHDDTRRVLEDLWGNPPDDEVLGMLVPDDAGLESEHSWAVLLTYSDDGHVSDEDASKIDYAKMLQDMQQEALDSNAARKEAGFETVRLVGWALPPSYDASTRKLHWAKELDFEGTRQHSVNYDVRVLGREGFVSMNAIASMPDLPLVRSSMERVIPMVEFDAGHRYADFKPGSDKVAAYGLAALVGGGIAAKAGLFAKLGVVLLAAKKFIVIGLLALGALMRKIFGGKKDDGSKNGGTFG